MKIQGEEQAYKALRVNKSPEYLRLERLEAYYDCDQYRGRPSWWSDDVPQWEREPCIVYPIVKMAISSNVDLMLGERAFPAFKVAPEQKKANGEVDLEQQTADDVLADLHRVSRFRTASREAFEEGQKVGTAVAVFGVRGGLPFQDLIPAKWCKPEFKSQATFEVKKLTIEYPYLIDEEQADGSYRRVCMLYKRVIDEESDTVYKAAEANEDGRKNVNWQKDQDASAKHSLGFCPVVWYPFMRGCKAVNVINGTAIHEGTQDEIHAHDLSRSQWHKIALYSEPQPVECGVTDNDTKPMGRSAIVPSSEYGGESHPEHNPVTGNFVAGPSRPSVKKGMGYRWQYSNPDTKVQYLTVPSDAVESIKGNTMDLRQRLQEAMAVVFLDPENIKFAATTSGKALEAIKQKQVDRIDQYREDFRDWFLIPSLKMQLRIIRTVSGIMIPGIEKLQRLNPDTLHIEARVLWGSYSAPDFSEQKSIIELLQAALGKSTAGGVPLIDLKLAIEKLRENDVFEIEDVDDLLARLKSEADSDEPEPDAKPATEPTEEEET